MNRLHWEIQQVMGRMEGIGYKTRHGKTQLAHAFGNWLEQAYPGIQVDQLKQRHFLGYIEHKKRFVDTGQLKNIATVLRTLARGIGKANLLPKDNRSLGMEKRILVATSNRAAYLTPEQLERLEQINPSYRLAAEGQMAAGIRAQEAGKFDAYYADRGGYLKLLGSWCKNGRERAMDMFPEILEWTDKVKSRRNPGQSVADRKIHNWYQGYNRALKRAAGITSHDLRHGWFHRHYERLTGHKAPVAGGPQWSQLPPHERRHVRAACKWLSEQSGHNRLYVVSHYLGKLR